MAQRLDKIKADLEAAKEKRAWWDNRIRYLEKKLSDEEKTIVHDIVKAAIDSANAHHAYPFLYAICSRLVKRLIIFYVIIYFLFRQF